MAAKWPLLVEPRIVPPRGSRLATAEPSSGRMRGLPIRPSKPCSTPVTDQPHSTSAVLTTARITAFSPGASPPLVRIAMRRIGPAMMYGHPQVALVRPKKFAHHLMSTLIAFRDPVVLVMRGLLWAG